MSSPRAFASNRSLAEEELQAAPLRSIPRPSRLAQDSRMNRIADALPSTTASPLDRLLRRRLLERGTRFVQIWLNGFQTVDYTESSHIPQSGVICLQIHGGAPAEAVLGKPILSVLRRMIRSYRLERVCGSTRAGDHPVGPVHGRAGEPGHRGPVREVPHGPGLRRIAH